MKIIMDTSSLEYINSLKKDMFEGIEQYYDEKVEYYVTEGVIKELEEHSKEKGNRGTSAKLTLTLIKSLIEQQRLKRIVEPLDYTYSVDDALIKVSKDMNGILLTQDKELRKKAKVEGLKTITYKRSGTIGD